MRFLIPLIFMFSGLTASAQTWVDSLDNFAREVHLPARNYVWNWQNASLLHAMEVQYEMMPEGERDRYLEYVRIAMSDNFFWANGLLPNFVASGNGMAFMYRITAENRYLESANKVYNDYLNIVRVANGGVSHLPWTLELWDDTIYMIGIFLLGMYRATGEEEYIAELIAQIRAHQEKLRDENTGLWVHGWDEDGIYTFDFCSEADWADPATGRSDEFWGRGNGWVVVTLSELLNTLPEEHHEREFIETSLLEMIDQLPEWQDENTGHWYQLPALPEEADNFIESSCTAMFGYGILTALKYELVSGTEFETAARKAYYGLRNHSMFAIDPENPYLNTRNVCAETCIGDKDYYFSREVANGRSYALAMSIIFGRAFEEMYMNDIPTAIEPYLEMADIKIYPTLLHGSAPTLYVEIPPGISHNISMELTDPLGRTVHRFEELLNTGLHKISFQKFQLVSGQYFALFRDGGGNTTRAIPIIIQ